MVVDLKALSVPTAHTIIPTETNTKQKIAKKGM